MLDLNQDALRATEIFKDLIEKHLPDRRQATDGEQLRIIWPRHFHQRAIPRAQDRFCMGKEPMARSRELDVVARTSEEARSHLVFKLCNAGAHRRLCHEQVVRSFRKVPRLCDLYKGLQRFDVHDI